MSESRVLEYLKILVPEQILKLIKTSQKKGVPLKKVAGESFVLLEDEIVQAPKERKKTAQVIPFPSKPSGAENNELDDAKKEEFQHCDLVLMTKQFRDQSTGHVLKIEGHLGYKKISQGHFVKFTKVQNREARFILTQGILVDKKQA